MALNMFLNRAVNVHNFNPETSIPDLGGKVIVLTGGNIGLGYQSLLQLVPHNPQRIYLTARTKVKFDAAMSELQKQHPNSGNMIQFVEMDLASLPSVKTAAETILADASRIDILMNNAGVMGAAPALTSEGFEIHFGTNHMGHALLTKLLMPLLLRTAEQSEVRVVNVSSGAYQMADSKKGFDEQLVKTDMASFGGSNGNLMSRYGQSKLANVLHAKGLAKHYPSVTSVSITPGRVSTGLLDAMYDSGRDKFYAYFQRFYDIVIGAFTPYEGARTQVWAATEPKKERVENGEIYTPVGKKDCGNKFSNDPNMADKLWNFTEEELRKLGY